MENPGFQDSDQSMYESTLGIRYSTAMPHRRPHHLATLHHSHPHTAAVITHAHAALKHGIPEGPHSNTLSHVHLAGGAHGMPATAHLHGGRVVGVTGVPSGHTTPVGTPHGVRYADPNSIQSLYSAAQSQPLYSCQAPRGHEHVYQCPGHRDQIDQHHHHLHHSNNIDDRDQRLDHQNEHLDHRDLHRIDRCEHRYIERREPMVDPRSQVDIRDQSSDPDHRTEYHYGGSDYSSTEPIYAQPHLHPQEGIPSPSRTPPLAYTNIRGSLRTSSSSSPRQHGTPARFLLRTDSTGASTSSSILPTVSALLSIDHPQARQRTHSNEFSKSSAIQHTPGTPAKLKGGGVFEAWRAKYLRGGEGNRRGAILVSLLVLLLILVLGGLATVLYLTLGGGFGSSEGQTPQLIKLTEKGSSVVTVEFRILNQNFWPGLEDPQSDAFRTLSQSIEQELDQLFLNSVWSRAYNRSEVVSLAPGSLIVRSKIYLNSPDTTAAKKFGSTFLRGLHTRHKQEWLGRFTVDISSIRFAEYLVDSTSPLLTTLEPTSSPRSTSSSTTVTQTRKSDVARKQPPTERPNVGWGEWGPWSSCNPCSPQYDQIRTRKCRLDNGKGLLITIIEWCLPDGHSRHLRGSVGDRETRHCQCNDDGTEVEEDGNKLSDEEDQLVDDDEIEDFINEYSTDKIPVDANGFPTAAKSTNTKSDEPNRDGICETCEPGQVCVAIAGEVYPVCRQEKDPDDRTGCGGLCAVDTEVCQPRGSRAFQCHSASQCLDDEWRCKDGLCIPQAKRCDGHLNCYDRSDEVLCKCSENEFHCGNETSCIPMSARCDGNLDCWDGLDEANCTDGTGDVSQLSPSAIGTTRVGTTVMNRTAIGLSSLSHRERELLS